jgi:glycerophosphoryl diester phosphodiesterase
MRIIILIFSLISSSLLAQPYVIAHRGASAYKPENSLSAFEEAIKMQADYIETDVHQTKDGSVVIMHDFTVDRTCEGYDKNNTSVKDLTLAQFCDLRLKGTNEHPPTLDSAIKFINGRCKLLIEIKKGSDLYPGIENNILEIIKANKAEDWVNIIHSFDKKALLTLQKQQTGVQLQRLVAFRLPLASFTFSKEKWKGVNANGLFTSKRFIRKMHSQNKTVFSWTINKERKMKKLVRRQVDGIITNKPDVARRVILNAGKNNISQSE